MKVKLNDAQARAYIAGDQSKPVQEIALLIAARDAIKARSNAK